MMRILTLETILVNVLHASISLPTVKPGLFVIHGVYTCGNGDGFCLMGNDCTVNEEFLPDPEGHCEGLRSAFIPGNHFSCCRFVPNNSTFDEFSTDQPPTSTLSEDTTEIDSIGSLNENSEPLWLETHFESGNTTENASDHDQIVKNRVSQVKRADAQRIESSDLPETNSEVMDIVPNIDNTLYLESTNQTDGSGSRISTSNSTTNSTYPKTGLIDLNHEPEYDSIHSIQLLHQSQKVQYPLEMDELGEEGLEPRSITSSVSDDGTDTNYLRRSYDIRPYIDSPAYERIEDFSSSNNQSFISRDYPKDINDHKHERSPAQWFRIARKFSSIRPTEMTIVNPLDVLQVLPTKSTSQFETLITIPKELRGSLVPTPERCLSFPNAEKDVPKCMSTWKFIKNNAILCFGTLINSIWVLTSASCITKIYDADMESVSVTDVEGISRLHKISTMIVHENYKAGNVDELNNIGLISLDSPTDSSCLVCFSNEEKQYSDKTCSTYVLTSSGINERSLEKCEDRVKVLNMHSKLYLSLLCDSSDNLRQLVDNGTANMLWCEDTLAGIETTFTDGVFVFTPTFEHANWIQKNIQQYL